MITREEAKKYFSVEQYKDRPWMQDITEYDFITFIDKLFDQFEQHIKSLEAQLDLSLCNNKRLESELTDALEVQLDNTEQITCGGCKLEFSTYNSTCAICKRYRNDDFYVLKDTQ